jgi:DNA-binding PadR family transcriptional regulator
VSVRHGLLALLAEGPRYGYQLRAEFEARTGATWPLNVGQVYTTLARLERDGLVEPAAGGEPSQVNYRITAAGREAVDAWFSSPVERTLPPRDELAIKLALAVTVPGVDVQRLVQRQRTATVTALRDYTRMRERAGNGRERAGDGRERGGIGRAPGGEADRGGDGDLAWLLVIDSLIFAAEAEIRWLDHCEARLARAAARPRQAAAPTATPARR